MQRVEAMLDEAKRDEASDPRERLWRVLRLGRRHPGARALVRAAAERLAIADVFAEACIDDGVEALAAGDEERAYRAFYDAFYAPALIGDAEAYVEHPRLLAALEQHAASSSIWVRPSAGRRLRVAFLAQGMAEPGSVLVRLLTQLLSHRDRGAVEAAVFLAEDREAVSRGGGENVRGVLESGVDVVDAPERTAGLRYWSTARRIAAYRPDVVFAMAAFADPGRYTVLARLKGVPIVGLAAGPPAQFTPPSLDFAIACNRHALLDAPCDATYVPLEIELPARPAPRPSDGRCRVFFGGRPVKLQSVPMWRALLGWLAERKDAQLVVVGAGLDELPPLVRESAASRGEQLEVHGWTTDYLCHLEGCDVLLDTHPSGGGMIVMDALARAIPVVAFENDYTRAFSQVEWSSAWSMGVAPEALLPRHDHDAMRARLTALASDRARRLEEGEAAREHFVAGHGDPVRMARRYEEALRAVVDGYVRGPRTVRARLPAAPPAGALLAELRRAVGARVARRD